MNSMCQKILPKVSIIIATYNEENYIENLLRDIYLQDYENYEVIIADAQSTDRTIELARTYEVKVVSGGKPAVGRNNGAKHANGDLLLFFDADVHLSTEDVISKLVQVMQTSNVHVLGALFDINRKQFLFKMIYLLWNVSKIIRQNTFFPDLDGQCIMADKYAFKLLRGFNEQITVSEDSDFALRAVRKKLRFKIAPFPAIGPSERRYRQVGVGRVFLGSVVGGIAALAKIPLLQKFSDTVYGGFGKS